MKTGNIPDQIKRERAAAISSVAEIITERLPQFSGSPIIRIDNGKGYETIAGGEYLANICRMIAYLKKTGAEQKVIATFVKNRPEWDMTAFASFYTANVLFPLDTKMNEDELVHLLRGNPPDYLLVSKVQLPRARSLLSGLKMATKIWICDLYRVYEDMDAEAPVEPGPNEYLMTEITGNCDNKLTEAPSGLLKDPNTVLCNYATSGTVTLPRTVELTHGNIVFQVNGAMDIMNIRPNEDFLNLGPYTHIATLLEFLAAKARGQTVTYMTREPDEDDVLEGEIKKLKKLGVRIRALMAVPKFWIYLMKEVLEEIKNKPVLNNIYKHLISIEKNEHFYDIGSLDKAKLIAVRNVLQSKLGGYFAYGISSSSKIDPAVIDIFNKLGITIIDIYGATEVCGVIAKNSLNESRKNSCGKLLAGLEAKLSDCQNIPGISRPCGILHIRGPAVAKGYKGDAGPLSDGEGFYNTGDIACMDEDNWVTLVGRKKELIQWPDGSYSDLMRMSNLLVRSIWIKDAMAVRLNPDDGHLSVFVYPDYQRIRKDGRYNELIKSGLQEPRILRILFEEAVDYAQSISGPAPILSKDKIYILDRKLERTPTHKIKFISELKKLDSSRYL